MARMNPSLYEAAATGDVGFLEKIRDGRLTADLLQKTPKENNILHIAAELKQINFIKEVKIHHESPRFWATNKNGETPLHVAARVGCDEVVTFLIDHTISLPIEGVDSEEEPIDREAYKKLLRMTNSENDTALHVAVRYHHAGVVERLMRADPELCCSCYSIKESPLFLAVRAGSTSIADYILNETPTHISPSFQGTKGVTALHAVATRECFADKGIVQSMVSKNPGIIEEVDEIGWTPLHYASLRGNSKAAKILIQKSNSACYISDKLGMSALHVAEIRKSSNVVRYLGRDIVTGVHYFQQKIIHEFKKFESQGESSTSETPVSTTNTRAILQACLDKAFKRDTREILQAYLDKAFERDDSKLLVATLIATVTFTAVTNPPGGFQGDGTVVLKENAAYKVFSFFNLASFSLSVLAIYNESSPISVLSTRLPTPKRLINCSIAGMGIAFFAGGMAVEEKRRPGQSTVKYLFADEPVITIVLTYIGFLIIFALAVTPYVKSLNQITWRTRIDELQNHKI